MTHSVYPTQPAAHRMNAVNNGPYGVIEPRPAATAPPQVYIQTGQLASLSRKLAVLADAAKYDASCASSGAGGRDSTTGQGIGSTQSMGICHSYTPDGRCISLLKILLTNFCIYDCLYCINRASSNVARARFSAHEVVQLTLDFYRRNVIEGLFLSSGIIQSPNYTMAQLVEVARQLRQVHDFRGYIHLKTIPDADPELLLQAGRFADRLSINIELPTQASLAQLAPEKNAQRIVHTMRITHQKLEETKALQLEHRQARARLKFVGARRSTLGAVGAKAAASAINGGGSAENSSVATPRLAAHEGLSSVARHKPTAPPRFAPGGQSTQMIIGADATNDKTILTTTGYLYQKLGLRRVYYSAYSPIAHASAALPAAPPPLLREHRLYQADWLLRFYGYQHEEITPASGMLDLELDPKLAWALARREFFPVDLQSAPREALLRVPGLGPTAVGKILSTRRLRTLRLEDLAQLRIPLHKALPFCMCSNHHPGRSLDAADLRSQLLDHTTFTRKQLRAELLGQAQQALIRHEKIQSERSPSLQTLLNKQAQSIKHRPQARTGLAQTDLFA